MFSQNLLETLKPLHLLGHPFYQAWMKGDLSMPALQNYAAQYYPHVLAFPGYVSAVHSLCPDEDTRHSLARNLCEEEGLFPGTTSHPELWLHFGEGLGLERNQIKETNPNPAAKALRDGFFDLCRRSYAEGLAALFAYEYQVPEISKTKIEGLKRHYGVHHESGLAFFKVHEEADLYHSGECRLALDRLSDEEKPIAEAAAVKASTLLWDFLSEAMINT